MVLKDAAYTVLGEMIAAIEAQPLAGAPVASERLSAQIGAMLDAQIQELRARMDRHRAAGGRQPSRPAMCGCCTPSTSGGMPAAGGG